MSKKRNKKVNAKAPAVNERAMAEAQMEQLQQEFALQLRAVNDVLDGAGKAIGYSQEDVSVTQLGFHCLRLCLRIGSINTLQLMSAIQKQSAMQAKIIQEQHGGPSDEQSD